MILPNDLDEVCSLALQKWGWESQEAVAIGELGELLTLFGKRAQGRATYEQWVDEIADSFIMLHQLAHLHGIHSVAARINVKTRALRARIEKPTL